MSVRKPPAELGLALAALQPYFVRVGWFSLVACLLVLMPSWYMLEVYDRVVNSGSHMTLAMLTLLVLASYVVMEVLEWARSEVMHEGSRVLDRKLRGRVFTVIFEASLRRVPGGTQQPLNDLRTVRDFLYSPALLAVMDAPVSLVFLGLIFFINPLLGWVAVVAAVVQVLVGWWAGSMSAVRSPHSRRPIALPSPPSSTPTARCAMRR